jgi:large subunit ribosomal protein L29
MAKEQKTQKAEDLKGKSPDELNALLKDLRKQQMNMRFQRAGGQLENTSEMRKVRRTIARVKTVLNQQATGTAPAAAPKAKKSAKKAA